MESAHGGERELSPEEEAESREGRLLREMVLRARWEAEEEPQVPDEQLHANDQLQRDEMLALEAIYGGNISIFGEKFGLRSFEILVHCEIPDGILVSAELFQEVVYEWVQWLQSSALSHLGFDDGLAIHHSDSMMGPVDVRAVGEIVPVESVVQWLISYNEEQCHESFVSGVHNCTICLSEYAGVDFIKLPCQHYFYQRCMETYSRMHVKEGTVLKLLCPDDQCRGDVPPHLLKILLGDADFERWERLILQKTLDSMADAAYCPRCETICLEDEENNAQCSKCFFSFCTHCRIRCHIGKRCGSITPEEKLLSLREREKVRRLSDGDIEKTISLAKEILNIKEVLCLCVQCPNCGTGISRVSGCNQMVCWNCGQPFCCGCGVAGCRGCNSISARNDPEKVKELDVTPLLTAQIDAVEGPRKAPIIISSRKYPCPSCRQPNSKVENNNHIFCLACQVHYCALCRKVVRKYAEHYGPRGCKQHSVDP